jgi:hypothetical protein
MPRDLEQSRPWTSMHLSQWAQLDRSAPGCVGSKLVFLSMPGSRKTAAMHVSLNTSAEVCSGRSDGHASVRKSKRFFWIQLE